MLSALALAFALAACGSAAEDEATPQTSTGGDENVVAFVERFMKARQGGLPADRFLSTEAQAAYENHTTALWLYDDTLPGGPGGEYVRFTIAAGPESGEVQVRTRVEWTGDAAPSEMVELLTVGHGTIVDAKRTDDGSDDGLPTGVAETREDIYRAAVSHDYEALQSLLDVETFTYSFGEKGDPIAYWRKQEKGELPLVGDILPGVLHTRFDKSDDIFMWPSAAAKEPSEWTPADLASMKELGYTEDDFRSFRQYGGYTGWRAGIRADGTWLFFIAGD